MDLFVPTEYSNLCLDSEDFIYATISTFDGAVESAEPIRKLNAKGTDILVRNGYNDPYGDLRYTEKRRDERTFQVCRYLLLVK